MKRSLPVLALVVMLISSPFSARSQDVGLVLDLTEALGSILSSEQELYFYQGEMILSDGWLVEGEIAINVPDGNELVTIILTEEEEIVYDNSEIDIIRLFNPREGVTTFKRLQNRRSFSREVYVKNDSLKVYDSGYEPFENDLKGRVYLVKDDKVDNLWSFWTGSAEKDLINYLRKRDGVKYRRRDFKTVQEIFEKL